MVSPLVLEDQVDSSFSLHLSSDVERGGRRGGVGEEEVRPRLDSPSLVPWVHRPQHCGPATDHTHNPDQSQWVLAERVGQGPGGLHIDALLIAGLCGEPGPQGRSGSIWGSSSLDKDDVPT